jgi:multiple sugar transport system substrate-binding protein
MQRLLIAALLVLLLASLFTGWLNRTTRDGEPVLYWVTDANPARQVQVDGFHRWLERTGRPRFRLELDTANVSGGKIEIQAVSGVCADLIDATGGPNLRFRQAMGILTDITDWAREMGFAPENTYPAMEPELCVDGRQYAFPCNVTVAMLWVNRATLARHGLAVPPRRWSLDDFEALGRAYVAAANQPGRPRRHFFVNSMPPLTLARSLGVDLFNETQTACALDTPATVAVFERIRRWIDDDRLLPSLADQQQFATEAGYGGAAFQLFNSGNYAMVWGGRYALIQFRQFGALDLAVVEPPHGGFPNAFTGTRATAVYAGGRNQELARHFLAYLASEEYNLNIVEDGDALPPNPAYTRVETFLRPPAHTNEWGCHEVFAETAQTIAIAGASSPFVLDKVATRHLDHAFGKYLAGLSDAATAVREATQRIDDEIARALRENGKLRPEHAVRQRRQREIERYRRDGRRVPLDWLDNPFHRRYYVWKGWADPA